LSAIGLFRGNRHVIEYLSDDFIEWIGEDLTGQPVYEALPDPAYLPMRLAMDDVLATGEPHVVRGAWGVLTITPRFQNGALVGVASHYPVSLRDRLRPLRLPVGLLGMLAASASLA
jgi:hypothetical protein